MRWLLVLAVGVVLVMGVGAAWSFGASQRALVAAYDDFGRLGATLSVDECVDEVLRWRAECPAMASLCDSNVERMTYACLTAQPRGAFCADAAEQLSDSHFAAGRCKAHGVERSDSRRWKHCGMAYRAVDLHCKELVAAPGAERAAVGAARGR